MQQFVDRLLTPSDGAQQTQFVTELEKLLEPVRVHGAVNSLAQMVLKATSPGVPDFYQGTDLWDLSLVDPDNRRPVDYTRRADVLQAFAKQESLEAARDVLASLEDGRVKLFAMQKTLAVRNAHRAVFDDGAYTPLEVTDPDHAFAFLRGEDVLVVIPRFTYTLAKGGATMPLGETWHGLEVTLPEESGTKWVNAFTGKEVSVKENTLPLTEVFADFPVAVFTRR